MDWYPRPDDECLWAVAAPGMSHTKHIHGLKFRNGFVDARLAEPSGWNVISTLGSLEELVFDSCCLLSGPRDVEPDEKLKAKIKVSCLWVVDCRWPGARKGRGRGNPFVF